MLIVLLQLLFPCSATPVHLQFSVVWPLVLLSLFFIALCIGEVRLAVAVWLSVFQVLAFPFCLVFYLGLLITPKSFGFLVRPRLEARHHLLDFSDSCFGAFTGAG